MTWYSEGTVAVTQGSATVTGTGVAFTANSRVGDGFQGPDGRWYELTNYASDTVISIDPPYIGDTGAGLTYRIAPLQGYNKQTADMLREIAEEMADFVIKKNIGMLANLEGLPNKGFYFDTADSMATYDLAAAGRMFLGLADKEAQRTYLLIDQVDNTSDMDKPVSTLQQQALALKADAQAVDQALALKADQDVTDQALAGKADKQETLDALTTKVDKLPGKALSTNDFTDELYNKLSTIEGSRWQGVYTSIEALATAKPVGEPGWFAWVDAGEGQPVKMAIWDIDDQQWRISSGEGGTMTPAQVLEALNANPDVNVLTDAQLAKLVETLVFSQADKDKLDGVDTGAQKNPDAVSQAEAQEGTVTALRSWSVLRVWQAIQAWWNASAMKTKLDAIPAMPPADGKTYALKDGQWVEAASGAGGNLFDVQFYTGLRANLPTERPGFAFLDGQKALRSVWPDAFARITNYPIATEAAWTAGEKGKFTLGDGSTDFRLADWNGATGGKPRVLRGGIAGTEGAFEEDALQGHWHGGISATSLAANSQPGDDLIIADDANFTVKTPLASNNLVKVSSDGTNGTPRISNETRAASVKGAWIVRLSNAAGPVGQVDVQALASEVAALPSKVPVLIKETYYRTPGAISHTFNSLTSVYEVEVWSGGAGSGAGGGDGGASSFGSINITGAKWAIQSGGKGGLPGIASGGLLNLNGAIAGSIAPDGWASTGAAAPRGGSGGASVIAESVAFLNGQQPAGGAGAALGAGSIAYGSSGGYSFDRKAVVGGSTITGMVGSGGAAGTNGGKGGDAMIIVREYSSNLPGVDVVNQLISQMPKYYESPPLAWTPGGTLNITHNLGVKPKSVTFWAVAKQAVAGLAVGEDVQLILGGFGTAAAYGPEARKASATLINVAIAKDGLACLSTSGGATPLTAAQVDLIIKVQA